MNLSHTIIKSALVLSILAVAETAAAQAGGGVSMPSVLTWVVVILVLSALVFIGDSLLKLQARNVGVENENDYSIFPKWSDLFRSNIPDFTRGQKVHTLSKGFDIKLEGGAKGGVDGSVKSNTFAIKPTDFNGMSPIPKVMLSIGDSVKAGEPLLYDKKNPDVMFCAPVSGELIAVNRGAKRAIMEVVILADGEQQYIGYELPDLATVSREDLVAFLAANGALPLIKRRPYNLVPKTDEVPRDIFVSTFDTAPLAPDSNLFVADAKHAAAFQKGLDVLARLTPGRVYLGLNGKSAPAPAYASATGVEKSYFHGAHPAGNVGVQIHHAKPISGQDVVWTLGPQEVITIGAMFTENRFNTERVVALTGALDNPRFVRTNLGTSIENFVKGGLSSELEKTPRYISGDVLTGTVIPENGFLGTYDDQLTVLAEGDDYEMFGWLLPLTPRPSLSHTMPGFLMPDMEYKVTTNTHGEKRAFVVTGEYERVLPMDIYPQHLMKAILTGNFERMEGLGINELEPEDIAICEFVCTSKQPLQSILKDGQEMMIEQS